MSNDKTARFLPALGLWGRLLIAMVVSALLAGTVAVADAARAYADAGAPDVGAPFPSTPAEAQPVITTTGTATVHADPDTADVSMGISVEGADAAECQNRAADVVDAVMAALIASGLTTENVTTANLNLYPVYDYSTESPAVGGYRLEVSVNVIGVEVGRVGEVVSAATGAGANQVWGVTYYTSRFDELYREALLGALDAARVKAEAIAGHEGLAVGGAQSVTEGYENRSFRSASLSNIDVVEQDAQAAMADAYGRQIAIDPGTIEITASATVTYAALPADGAGA